MKLLINIRPQLRNRISVSQNGKTLYEGTLTDDPIEIDGVSEGEISVGMNSYLIPLKVKANSIVIINDTVSSRRRTAAMAGSLLALFAIYAVVPRRDARTGHSLGIVLPLLVAQQQKEAGETVQGFHCIGYLHKKDSKGGTLQTRMPPLLVYRPRRYPTISAGSHRGNA